MILDEAKGHRFYLPLLLVVVGLLFSLGLSNHGLWTADEPRVAEIGREMALTGNWAVPTLNQRPFLEEPPLYYASIAAVFKIFGGASDRIVRIPSAVFALGGVVALFWLGSMLFGPRTGFLAGFILATGGEYFRVAHWVIVDSALACFVALAMTFFVSAYLSENRFRRFLFYSLCYLSCGLAFFTKGFIGVVLPGLGVLTFLVFDRNLKEVLRLHLWFGILIFLAMTLPWFLALWQQGGSEYLRVFLVHNHLERFAGGDSGHHQPFYYYLTQFPGGFLPWSLLLVPVFYRSFRKGEQTEHPARKGVLFAKCWFIAGFIFLSLASTKRVLYLMPIFPPIALLTAHYVDGTLAGISLKKLERAFHWAFGLTLLATSAAIVPLYLFFSGRYGLGTPLKETAWIVAFSLIGLLLSIAALWVHKRDIRKFWINSSAAVVSLLLLGLIGTMPILDRYKSFVPFCDTISATVPAASTLYAYKADETLRGAVPFYTRRFLREVDTISRVEEAIRKGDAVFVVVRDSRGRLEKELLSTGRLSVLARHGDPRRSLVLFGSSGG